MKRRDRVSRSASESVARCRRGGCCEAGSERGGEW